MHNHTHTSRFVLACALTLPSLFATASVPEPANTLGYWHGSLDTPTGSVALELNIVPSPSGSLTATLESVDQAPGQLIPVSQVQSNGEQLTLDLSAISAKYQGHFDSAKGAWVGQWQQAKNLPLVWTRGALAKHPVISGIDGLWRGSVERNGALLHLILHVETSPRGTLARLDSPDMNLTDLVVSDLSRTANKVTFRVPLANVLFRGDLTESTGTLTGTWQRQGMPEAHVIFVRAPAANSSTDQSEIKQSVASPTYASKQVQFENVRAGISLSGTLTLPDGPGPFTAAILISGSGPQDRDESGYGHRPFAVLADYLSRQGVAVLRFDDRGVGKSSGHFADATIPDFESDVRAAVAYMASQPDIEPSAIGLIGHSQGGIVAPLSAVNNPSVAYLVLLAAPATSMNELLLSQLASMSAAQGQSKAAETQVTRAMAPIYAALASAKDHADAREKLSVLLTPQVMDQLGLSNAVRPAMMDELSGQWMRSFLHYNAAETLAAIRIPVLAIAGSLDTRVPPEANLAAIRQALISNPDVSAQELMGLNHMFQTARSGSISEYAEIKETIAPQALSLIGDWIIARFGTNGHHA